MMSENQQSPRCLLSQQLVGGQKSQQEKSRGRIFVAGRGYYFFSLF